MTYATASLAPTQGTDAAFRAWGSGISALLAAAGLVQTADTGQINWATVTRPTLANTSQGYEIWRFPDALQATRPIFLKIEYGSGTNSGVPQMWVTVGTATDGAGTLSAHASFPGSTIARVAIGPAGSTWSAAGSFACHANYTDGEFCLVAFPGAQAATQHGWIYWISRTRGSDGAANGDGFTATYSTGGFETAANMAVTTAMRHFFGASPAQGASISGGLGLLHGTLWPAVTAVATGAVQWLSPVLTGLGYAACGPSKLLLACFKGDVPNGTAFTATHYGASHTWVGFASFVTSFGLQTATNPIAVVLRTD